VQLRLPWHTSETYVACKGWREARVEVCPEHHGRSCGFARHGTYGREWPRGARVARYYCPTAHRTFSLLPDFLASRLSGGLDEVEQAVITVEAASSLEAATRDMRPDVQLPGVLRWLRRRVAPVRVALLALVTLMPEALPVAPQLVALRGHLGTHRALVALREMAAAHLGQLPAPLGFCPRAGPRTGTRTGGPTRSGA
jgi:hypothetical protein